MDNKKKIRITCIILMLVFGISALVYDLKFDYRLVEDAGKHYFVFDDPYKWNVNFPTEGMLEGRVGKADLSYPNGKALISAIKLGNLTDEDKDKIASFVADSKGRIEMFDIDNFYEAIPAKGWKISNVTWSGKQYKYALEQGEWYGTMYFYHEELFDARFKRLYTEGKFMTMGLQNTRQEYLDDGQTKVIYHSYEDNDVEVYKSVYFSLSDDDREVYVKRLYSLSSEELIETQAFVMEGRQKYMLSFGRGVDVSDETLLQFGIEKVVFISQMLGVVIFIGVGVGGFYVYKFIKRRKTKEVIKSTTPNIASNN